MVRMAVPLASPPASCWIRDFDRSPIALAPPATTCPVVVPTATDWPDWVAPFEPSVPIVMFRPLLPIAMPTFTTIAFWLLCSPLPTFADCLTPVLAESPTAPAFPVLMMLLIVPMLGDPVPPAPTKLLPLFEFAMPTFTTSPICRMSTVPWPLWCTSTCWPTVLLLSVPVELDVPVVAVPVALPLPAGAGVP